MISISGAPPNIPPPPPYYDNYSGPANPACFLTLDSNLDWAGQSFTSIQRYNLASVELWIKKGPGANVGNINVKLYAVDGSGHPTGVRLNEGIIPNADIAEDYAWVNCVLDGWLWTIYQLSKATKYCIVVHGANLSGGNTLIWACGGDGSGYPNGDQELSINGGGVWTTDNTKDQLFRCYPTPWLDNYFGSHSLHSYTLLILDSVNDWAGQPFIAMKSYPLNHIDMWMGPAGPGGFTYGEIIIALYGVDENGHPDIVGGVLSEGRISWADIQESVQWGRCNMSGFNIVEGTKYAIVVHGFQFNASNSICLCKDIYNYPVGFEGEDYEWSTDGGGAWNAVAGYGLFFRCYSA